MGCGGVGVLTQDDSAFHVNTILLRYFRVSLGIPINTVINC